MALSSLLNEIASGSIYRRLGFLVNSGMEELASTFWLTPATLYKPSQM